VTQACGVTLALAAAAWLLLTRASSETEERVFALSALLLVGGVAAALSLSALFGGLVAGLFWRYAGRHPREAITRDVLFVQHPLLVLVLLVAGARADPSPAMLALGGAYVGLRVAGQLAAGLVASRVVGVNAPRDLGLHLLPPGVFGVGFALNAGSVVGADASLLLAVVVAGTLASELIAVRFPPRRVGE
jgi:Kef-type K+ transport system membrane component KefB